MKEFDLNIEKILENWETFHAVREIIANAIDEQLLTNTKEITILKNDKIWSIRDFGRGIHYTNLTQNENNEKLINPNVIGKFGIGLKDALATFDRKKINVLIRSKYGEITLVKTQKHNFKDVVTLHANIDDSKADKNIVGTEFIITGLEDTDIEHAKSLFLRFTGERILEKNKSGEIVEKSREIANIYINGVKVAEEENFLFSYNITSLTKAIRKALNRERTNVGRSAYSERVKAILLETKNVKIANSITDDLSKFSLGTIHDELQWIDVQEHAVKLLNSSGKFLFITSWESMVYPDAHDEARIAGYNIIIIPDNLKLKINGQKDYKGNPIVDLSQFIKEKNDSVEFKFISPDKLTPAERKVFDLTDKIFKLIGGRSSCIREIMISETMRKSESDFNEELGLWIGGEGKIVIKRSELYSIAAYACILIHESIHARTGLDDINREFENELGKVIGILVEKILK